MFFPSPGCVVFTDWYIHIYIYIDYVLYNIIYIYMCVCVNLSLSLCYYCVCQGCNGNPRISMHPDELVYVYGKHLPTSTSASQPNRIGRDGADWSHAEAQSLYVRNARAIHMVTQATWPTWYPYGPYGSKLGWSRAKPKCRVSQLIMVVCHMQFTILGVLYVSHSP